MQLKAPLRNVDADDANVVHGRSLSSWRIVTPWEGERPLHRLRWDALSWAADRPGHRRHPSSAREASTLTGTNPDTELRNSTVAYVRSASASTSPITAQR